MVITTEGIVIRQVKTPDGRRILHIFTKDQGKISVGTNKGSGGRSKSDLAYRPFTYASYHIFQGRNYYELNSASVIKSHYSLGEDIGRYAAASYVLELTDRLLTEDLPEPRIFALLSDFLSELEKREKKHETLVIAYEIKLLKILGVFPVIDKCVICGKENDLISMSVEDGGMVCGECSSKLEAKSPGRLIYPEGFDIIKVIRYFADNPLQNFSGIALSNDVAHKMSRIIREYIEYHFDLGELKSEGLFSVMGDEPDSSNKL